MQSYLRRADRPVVAGLALTLLFTGQAKAAGLGPDSDILGIRTTMTSDQVKQVIQQRSGSADFAPVTIKFGTPAYSRDVGLGFVGNIISKADTEANQKRQEELRKANEAQRAAGCSSPLCQVVATGLAKDNLTVYVDPNAGSTVLAVVRQTDYAKDGDILASVFVQSLEEKYGKVSFKDQYDNYYWVDTINPTNTSDWSGCSRIGEDVGNLQKRFPSLMNDFARNSVKPPKCTMYLRVHLSLVGRPGEARPEHVSNFTMMLVNARNSYSALSTYAAAFWNAANSADRDRLSRESQNKPKL